MFRSAILLSLVVFFADCKYPKLENYSAADGSKGFSLTALDSNWVLFKNQILNPEDISRLSDSEGVSISLPYFWDIPQFWQSINNPYHTLKGNFRIESCPDPNLDLLMPEQGVAFKVFVDGTEVIKSGTVSSVPELSEPDLRWKKATVSCKDSIEIVIQTSNFDFLKDGIFRVPILGTSENVTNYEKWKYFEHLFVAGILLGQAIHHLIFFLIQRRGIHYLFYSCFLFTIFLLHLFLTPKIILDLNIDISFLNNLRIYHILDIFSCYFFLQFLYHKFPNTLPKIVLKIFLRFIFVYCIFLLMSDALTISRMEIPMDLIIVTSIVLSFYTIYSAFRKNHTGVFVLIIAFGFLTASVLNEILTSYGLYSFPSMISTGISLFTLFVSSNMAFELVNSQKLAKSLAQRLEFANRNLEEKVETRTKELVLQTKELMISREKLEKALQSKTLFLASISHEMRTPLTGILGYTNFLKSTQLSSEQKEQLDVISKSGTSLMTIISDLLDSSKLEYNKIDLSLEDFYIVDLVFQCTKTLEDKISERNGAIEFSFQNSISENLRISADPNRIRQVVLNILSNAIKYTPKGTIVLNMQMTQLSNRDFIEIQVTDSGIGISEEDQKYIFDPFSNIDKEQRIRLGGNGLGLYISKKLAELMQGDLFVQSQKDIGSSFTFTFPLDLAKTPEPKKDVLKKNENLSHLKVLIVEDNAINQKVLMRILQTFQIQSDLASNGKEALEKVKLVKYDLIFMDIQMPVLDGIETTKWIRKNHPKEIVVVGISANVFSEDIQLGLSSGMNEYLSKPFDPEDIKNILYKYSKPT